MRRWAVTTSGRHGRGSPPRPGHAGHGARRGIVRRGCLLHVEARAVAAHGVVQAAGAFNKMLVFRHPGRRRDSGVRRELRPRGRLRRARARASREIFVPDTSPAAKIRAGSRARRRRPPGPRLLRRGERGRTGTGRRDGRPMDASRSINRRWWRAEAGGSEIASQVPDADTVLVAIGGGGLIAGIAAWSAATSGSWAWNRRPARRCRRRWRRELRWRSRSAASLPTRSGRASSGTSRSAWLGRRGARRLGSRRGDHGRAAGAIGATCTWSPSPGGRDARRAAVRRVSPAPGERVVVLVCGANTDPASVV